MEKEFNPGEAKKIDNIKEHENDPEVNDIDQELDNKYDSYLEENQSPEFKFVSNGEKAFERNKFQEREDDREVESVLDDKYNEYIRSGKEFNYEAGHLNDVNKTKE